MDRPWFDRETGTLLLDEYVATMPSFQSVMADGVVTPAEAREQAERTIERLRRLESLLSPEARAVATDALCELAVLHALHIRQHLSAD